VLEPQPAFSESRGVKDALATRRGGVLASALDARRSMASEWLEGERAGSCWGGETDDEECDEGGHGWTDSEDSDGGDVGSDSDEE
jgi:hypothetical protein